MDTIRVRNEIWFQISITSDIIPSPFSVEWNKMDPELEIIQAHIPDPQSLALIHDKLYPVIFRYVRFRLDDVQVCEDITSEVFLRLLNTLDKRKHSIKNLRGWLLGTAAHLINDHLRLHYSRPVETLDETHADNGPDPDEAAFSSWQQVRVREAMQMLTREQQHVLALRFSEERSVEETARLMDKTVGAVKTLQYRAIAGLRQRLRGERNGKGKNRRS